MKQVDCRQNLRDAEAELRAKALYIEGCLSEWDIMYIYLYIYIYKSALNVLSKASLRHFVTHNGFRFMWTSCVGAE